MARHLLRELGYDTRRVRVLMKLDEWEWVDQYAKKLGCDVAGVIGFMAQTAIADRRAEDRVDITPAGEEAADEIERLARASVASVYDEAPQC